MEEFIRSRVPWSAGPSLIEMTDEVGIDFDSFIDGLAQNKSDMEMAEEFGVTEKTIYYLRNQFERKGLGSTIGQD
ncbi:helix-turn-helix domain-containing protein [Thermincola potens]|uniref:Helix-turn-helix domain-containing protein n=1 Tax=Thermincola potens (strain JR) TaxID=635013 RepID=D5XEV5_THEPJ|nr:helix-turn-helix domain-containing protein [Thermincola potens]ADG82176.1 conserved hypothetical protein [Thermincola potens JR]